MSDTSTIDHLVAAWNDPDPTGRDAHLGACLADTFYYADPQVPAPITSAAGFGAYLEMFHAMGPGAQVTLDVSPGAHNGHALYRLNFGKDGAVFAHGLYYVDTDADGRITRVVGFLDRAG